MSHPAPVLTLPLPPAMARSLAAVLAGFPHRTRSRGEEYATFGLVTEIVAGPGFAEAVVQGTHAYQVSWEFDGGEWMADCSCPVGLDCKRAYALGRCLVDGDAQAMVPAIPPPVVSPPVPPKRPSPFVLLHGAGGWWERQHALHQLLATAPIHLGELPGAVLTSILSEEDSELRCWKLASLIAGHAAGWLPRELEPYRDRPELRAREQERQRAVLAEELGAWVSWRRQSPERSLRLVFSLDVDPMGEAVVGIETRMTSARVVDAPRNATQLQQLRGELRRDGGLFPPEQAALLAWLTDRGLGANRFGGLQPYGISPAGRLDGLRAVLDRVRDSPLATWGGHLTPALAARAGIAPGDPIRVTDEPVRLLPVCTPRDGAPWVELAFLWPDGHTRALEEVVLVREGADWSTSRSGMVLAAGVFGTLVDEPPAALVERFRRAGGLPLAPAERAATLGMLAARFPHLRETLRQHTQLHRVQVSVTLDLSDDDWLQLRVVAHAGAWSPGAARAATGSVFELSAAAGWARAERPAVDTAYEPIDPPPGDTSPPVVPSEAGVAEAWLEAPEPADTAAAEAWLAATGAVPATRAAALPETRRGPGWWLQASRRRMETFAEAWERRPGDVRFYGTERVRRLLGRARSVAPRIRIEASGVDWFSVSAEWQTEGSALSDADVAALRAATTRFVKLPSGWVRREVSAAHDAATSALADLGVEAGGEPQRLTLWQLAGARPETLRTLADLGADHGTLEALAELRRRAARFRGLPRVRVPAGCTARLRPYQREGLDFLVWATSLGLGVVLADDMGLGKTVQALAWLEHLRAAEPDGGPSLVVCPASVVHNWAREVARFAPRLRLLLLTRGRERHVLREQIAAHDLVVTNYALLRRDRAAWEEVALRVLILDEAQQVKNPDAAVTHAVAALRARHRLALTGTPLENRPLDLWSILNLVNPGYLGTRARFSARFDRLDASPHARTLLAARLRPVLLRRLKSAVARDLPPRIEERRDCELTPGQRRLYLAELRNSRRLVDTLGDEPRAVARQRITILAALTRLRQVCCHPALAGGATRLGSGKFDALFELLEPLLAEGHKVLVFSQFVECLKLLGAGLRARGIAQHVLTGETVDREAVVSAFTTDPAPCVFLVSLRAGGTGLNLTAASYVVLFDPWWNPAVEAQAIDRTHRIGQNRTVIAYRLLARGTIEEKIWDLQQRKAGMVRDVLGEGGFGRTLTRADLAHLFATDADDGA